MRKTSKKSSEILAEEQREMKDNASYMQHTMTCIVDQWSTGKLTYAAALDISIVALWPFSTMLQN